MLNCPDCHNNYNPGDKVCPHCGSLLYDPHVTLMPGTLLQDRYEIQDLSYRGSTFYIYISKDKKLYDRLCVIKQLKTAISSEPEKQQLEKAVLQTAQLSFPNVAMLLDHFVINSFYYLVVEYIAGNTLESVFRNMDGTIAEEEVIHWAISICDIVGLFHKQNITHGGINASTIMLTNEGFIKFIDFYTSHELQKEPYKYYFNPDKYMYIPPEQWLGRLEPRTDIFSIGALLYYLLTGFMPQLPEESTKGSPETGINLIYPPITEKNPGLSKELETVLQKALQVNVDNRYSTISELLRDLKNIIIKEPILSVDCDKIEFTNIVPGKSSTKRFTIRNEGSSRLAGKLNIDQPWINITPGSIEIETGVEEIQVTVDANRLPPGFKGTADLNIVTNGGKKSININVAVSSTPLSHVIAWTNTHKALTIFLAAVIVLGAAWLVLMNTVLKDTSTVTTESVLLFQDDFENADSGWYRGADESGSSEYKQGQYQLVVSENDYNILGRSNQVIGPLGDFALEVDARLISGPDDVWYGIGFRQQDKENSYDFLINSGESEGKGSFAILKQIDGDWIALKDWTESNDINGGKSLNHLKIICKGNAIEVYANDRRLAKVVDSAYSKGIITFEAAKETGDNASISFDDLLIYVPR
jgi:serine/threonine protein kinase